MKRIATSSKDDLPKRQKVPIVELLDIVSVLLQFDPVQFPLWLSCVNRGCRELVRAIWRQRYPKFNWKTSIMFRSMSTALFGEKWKQWESIFRNLHMQPHPNVAYESCSWKDIWPNLCDACKLTENGFVACLLWDYPLCSGIYSSSIGPIKRSELVRLVDAALQCDSVQLLHRITKWKVVTASLFHFDDHSGLLFKTLPPKCIAWMRDNEVHWKRFFWNHLLGSELNTRSPVFKSLRTIQDVKDFILIRSFTNNYDITEIYREFLSSIFEMPDVEYATVICEVGHQLGYEVIKEEMEELARHKPTNRRVSIYLFIKKQLPPEMRRKCRLLTLDWRFEICQHTNQNTMGLFNRPPNSQFDPMRLPPHAYLEHCYNSTHLLNLIVHVQRKGSDNAFAPLLPELAKRVKAQPGRAAAFDFLLGKGKSRASLINGAELELLVNFLSSV